MHPIIIPKELDAMVMVFLETLPRSYNTPNYKPRSVAVTAGFVHPSSSAPSALPKTGVKRKWSPPTEEQSPHTTFRKPGRPYRNVQSTLVLLVLALGKICLYRGKIPVVVHDPEDIMSSSPLIYNGILASPGTEASIAVFWLALAYRYKSGFHDKPTVVFA
ncbi:hypothetical protein F5Y17DRAFT_242089 [Xylariaceae sp. FL0594]|nr:hypothetical protein F5Y17DRAFT_242089 [Xylariaceae sp. FL0594]